MEELSDKCIEARKQFLLWHGVSEDVIADLDLSDDADEDQIVAYISDASRSVLEISIDAKGEVLKRGPYPNPDRTWASVSLPLLDTMLEIAGAAFNRLEVKFGFFPERFMAECAEDLLDVLVRHAPNVRKLEVRVDGLGFDGDRPDYAPWNGFLLDLIRRYPGIDDLFLDGTHFSEQALLEIRDFVPHVETLKLPEFFGNYMDPSRLVTTLLGFPHLSKLRIGVEVSWRHGVLTIDTHENRGLEPLYWDFYGPLLGSFLEHLPGLTSLVMKGCIKFEHVKLAIQAHPNLKEFTWQSPEMCTDDTQPHALIGAFPNLQSITCKDKFPCFHHEGMAQRILAAVKASGNLKSLELLDLRIPKNDEAVRKSFFRRTRCCLRKVNTKVWTKFQMDEETEKAIQHQLVVNRVKAVLGDNPTFHKWVVAVCVFRNHAANLEYLLQTSWDDGAGPAPWAAHALAAIGPGAGN